LEVTGKVERFATITPRAVRLNGLVGKTVRKSVKIIPQEKYPFTVTGVETKKGEFIRVKLDESKAPEKRGYLLTVENTKKEKGRYRDTILLKTTNTIRPKLEIGVWGNIYEPRPARPTATDNKRKKFIEAIKEQQKRGSDTVEEKPAGSGDPEEAKKFHGSSERNSRSGSSQEPE